MIAEEEIDEQLEEVICGARGIEWKDRGAETIALWNRFRTIPSCIHRRGIKLSQLFRDNRDLLVIHNMGRGCSYCVMGGWVQQFTPHLGKQDVLCCYLQTNLTRSKQIRPR